MAPALEAMDADGRTLGSLDTARIHRSGAREVLMLKEALEAQQLDL